MIREMSDSSSGGMLVTGSSQSGETGTAKSGGFAGGTSGRTVPRAISAAVPCPALPWQDDRLTGITDRHGHRITLRWTPGPRPLLSDYEVVDQTTLPGHLDTVTLPDGTRLR